MVYVSKQYAKFINRDGHLAEQLLEEYQNSKGITTPDCWNAGTYSQ